MPFAHIYTSEPSLEQIIALEGPVIIEKTPTGGFAGKGVDVVAIIGETLVGNPNVPQEPITGGDFLAMFGGFNKYIGDGAAVAYDGNVFLTVQGLKLSRLIVVPVDDRVGVVTLTRKAPGAGSIESGTGPFDFTGLASGGTHLNIRFNANAPDDKSLSFLYTPATHTGAGATYLAADTKELGVKINGGPLLTKAATVVELDQPTWLAWLNDALSFPGLAAVNDGGEVKIGTDRMGTGATLEIMGAGLGSDAEVLARLGLTPGVYTGTGNVSDHTAITAEEIAARFAAVVPLVLGLGHVRGSRFIASTATEGIAPAGIQCLNTSTADAVLGGDFATNVIVNGGGGDVEKATLPAGTRVSDGGANVFLIAANVFFDDNILEVSNVPIKQVSGSTVLAAAINAFVDTPDTEFFVGPTVTNPAGTTARPSTESGWLAKYQDALDALLADKAPQTEVSMVLSARHGVLGVAATALDGMLMKAVKDHCTTATSRGRARNAAVSPPLGVSKAYAMGSADCGVASTTAGGRHCRRWYGFPGIRKYVKAIVDDDPTLDGIIDCTTDQFIVGRASTLAPERSLSEKSENGEADFVLSLESAYQEGGSQGPLQEPDYKAFKASGICAPRNDDVNGFILQSQVTSVDPSTDPQNRRINDRRMRDFLFTSQLAIAAKYSAKLNTPDRTRNLLRDTVSFYAGLKSEDDPALARIADFAVVKSTPKAWKGSGAQLYDVVVETFDPMDNPVFRIAAGTTVDVSILKGA